jgi:hypothetical protein
VNRDVGQALGAGDLLVPGAEYDLPRELADRLIAGSRRWEKIAAGAKTTNTTTAPVAEKGADDGTV